MGPSLEQNPNIITLHAGTNDLFAPTARRENLPYDEAPERLAAMIDQIIDAVPDSTVILVAQLTPALDPAQNARTTTFNQAIPGIVRQRADAGVHIRVVDMSVIGQDEIDPDSGGVHPKPEGYRHMGDIWADAIRHLPRDWVQPPVGDDPVRPPDSGGANPDANGGPDPNIPLPDFGSSPVQPADKATVSLAAFNGFQVHENTCSRFPAPSDWGRMGQIAAGFGHDGNWKWSGLFQQQGKVADGLHLDPDGVRLVDMDGVSGVGRCIPLGMTDGLQDGQADYVHIDAATGRLVCYINNLPGLYAPAGNNHGIIASGGGWDRNSIRLADLDGESSLGIDHECVADSTAGDGKADYLVRCSFLRSRVYRVLTIDQFTDHRSRHRCSHRILERGSRCQCRQWLAVHSWWCDCHRRAPCKLGDSPFP